MDSNPNSTSNCTFVVLIPSSVSSLLGGVSLLNVFTNLLLMFSVKLTTSLKGNTGWLMINEQTSSLLYQVSLACGVIFSSDIITILVFMALVKGFHMAGTVFLTLQNFNMYLAVCRPASKAYTRFKSNSCSLCIVLFTWTIAAVNSVLTMQDIFLSTTCVLDKLKIVFHTEGLWIPIFLWIYGVCMPLGSNIFCLIKVYKRVSSVVAAKSLRQTHRRLHTIKRARLIFGNSILLSVINVPFSILNTVAIFAVSSSTVVQVGYATCWALMLIYITFRPVIYYTSYRPLWDSTKTFLFRRERTRSNAINIEVLPGPRDHPIR